MIYERHDTYGKTKHIRYRQIAAMAAELPTTNGHNGAQDGENNFAVKAGLARMLKGGVIMDVINAEQVSRLSRPFWVLTMANNSRPA